MADELAKLRAEMAQKVAERDSLKRQPEARNPDGTFNASIEAHRSIRVGDLDEEIANLEQKIRRVDPATRNDPDRGQVRALETDVEVLKVLGADMSPVTAAGTGDAAPPTPSAAPLQNPMVQEATENVNVVQEIVSAKPETSDLDTEIATEKAKVEQLRRDFAAGNAPGATTLIPTIEDRVHDLEDTKRLSGCSPKIAAIALVVAAIAIAIGVGVANSGGDSKPKTAAAANSAGATNAGAAANPDSPLDGHWVLADGLQNPYADMGLSCSHICDKPDHHLTIDKSSVTIDISGTKVTGGTYKTGFSSTAGSPCSTIESRVDATVTGNVDQAKAYGQLIADGTEVRKNSCDSNSQSIVTTPSFHTSRFFFVKDDTLTLCYNLNATFDGCTTTGLSLTPQELPNGGTAATFKRA